MSEVKLNLVDSKQILSGTLHGSIADSLVAALSAEPETLEELHQALDRYQKRSEDANHFAGLHESSTVDEEPWDAGIVIIDLAARMVAVDSSYSNPGPQGSVHYHDGTQGTDIPIAYRLSDDWMFVDSVCEYFGQVKRRKADRASAVPLDSRAVLYGRPFLEWLVTAVGESRNTFSMLFQRYQGKSLDQQIDEAERKLTRDEFESLREKVFALVSEIHANWLMTPRDDLRGSSPRDLLLAKQDLIAMDMDSRALQWTLIGEGPPCLAKESLAYRYAGFGLHEWIIYYDLVRHLIWRSLNHHPAENIHLRLEDREQEILRLEKVRNRWLETPESDYGGRVPAVLIENERKRLPIAMSPREMIVDEDCPACQMMAEEDVWGGPGFWHLDSAHMDEEFAFSNCRTRAEWEEEQRQREEFSQQFEREWQAREQQLASEEAIGGLYEHSGD